MATGVKNVTEQNEKARGHGSVRRSRVRSPLMTNPLTDRGETLGSRVFGTRRLGRGLDEASGGRPGCTAESPGVPRNTAAPIPRGSDSLVWDETKGLCLKLPNDADVQPVLTFSKSSQEARGGWGWGCGEQAQTLHFRPLPTGVTQPVNLPEPRLPPWQMETLALASC